MSIKTFTLRIAGGLLATALVATAFTGAVPANANKGTCTANPCPDLRFTSFTSYMTKGDGLYVSYEVKNGGKKDAGAFKTVIYLNGHAAYTISNPGLALG